MLFLCVTSLFVFQNVVVVSLATLHKIFDCPVSKVTVRTFDRKFLLCHVVYKVSELRNVLYLL